MQLPVKSAIARNKYFNILSRVFSRYSVVIGMVIVILVFGLLSDNFLTARNFTNILSSAAPLFFMAMGLCFVILTGSIDLSTGAICTCTCVFVGLYIGRMGNAIFLAVLLIGVLAGLLNGVLVSTLKMPSFIVTLCTTSIWKCAALILSGGSSRSIPLEFWPIFEWFRASWFIFPASYLIALAAWGLFVFIERFSSMGKSIYAVGVNVGAARMAGIQIGKAQITAYLLSGIGSAIAGAFYALRLRASAPTVGDSLTLVAIAIIVLGGTSLAGGKGTVANTLPSVITVVILQSTLKVIGLDAYWQDIVFGIVLIAAIYINSDRSTIKDMIIK
ncbi:MAG: ABC transporter permease [Treponema sp.]|jgi:ribose/xylose/arabinose/galactoside ABC-type transport system permease subunit|nr:ABC transporter permease [Treponema sp.]